MAQMDGQAVMDRVLQSATSRKRPRQEEESAPEEAEAASVAPADGPAAAAAGARAAEGADDAELRALLERADEIKVDAMDGHRLKILVHGLEKKLTHNQMLRAKYADNPAKFMDSEIALDAEVKALLELAASPELYPQFVGAGGPALVAQVLVHENTDIAIGAVDLLAELTDTDALGGAEEEAETLVNDLAASGALDALMQNLKRLDESLEEDARGVFQTMAAVEHVAEIQPEAAVKLVETTDLCLFLARRVRRPAFDQNKLYASELLSVLLQSDPRILSSFLASKEMDSLDEVLQACAQWRKRDPDSPDEEECCENVYNVLGCLLLGRDGQKRFRKLEGFELLIRVAQQRGFAAHCVLRALDSALVNSRSNCKRFVEAGGLRVLFPLFMGRGLGKWAKKKWVSRAKAEEQVATALSHLVTSLEQGGTSWERVLGKFLEKGREKVARLVELHQQFLGRVRQAVQRELAGEGAIGEEEEEALAAMNLSREERLLLRRMDAGLFALQRVDTCIAALCKDDLVRTHMLSKMHEQSESPSDVVSVLDEYASTLGDPDAQSEAQIEEERGKIRALRRHVLRDEGGDDSGAGQESAAAEAGADSGGQGESGQAGQADGQEMETE